jgi:hypothetical protein
MMGTLRHRASPLMSEFYRRILDRCHQQLLDFWRLPMHKWIQVKAAGGAKAGDLGVRLSRLVEESMGLSPVRGDVFFPVPAKQFYEQLCRIMTQRNQWDDDCLQCVVVERLSASLSVLYTVMRTPSPMLSDRDYLYLRYTGCQEIDGQPVYVVISCSVHRGDCPAVKGLVRGDIHFEGYYVQRGSGGIGGGNGGRGTATAMRRSSGASGEDLGCTVTYLASSDLKGWLPSFVANQVATSQAAVLAAVAESLFTVADADDSLVL